MRIVLLREKHILTKMHVQAECIFFFYFHFAVDIILGDRCDRKKHPKKTKKNNFFFSNKTSSFGG